MAFDIPCLRAIVTPTTGVLVPDIDAGALGEALVALCRDPRRRAELGAAGPATVAWMRWGALAARAGGRLSGRPRPATSGRLPGGRALPA